MSFVKRNAWTEAQIGAVLTELINKYCFSSHFLTAKIFTFIHFSTEIFSYFLKVIYKGVCSYYLKKKPDCCENISVFTHSIATHYIERNDQISAEMPIILTFLS